MFRPSSSFSWLGGCFALAMASSLALATPAQARESRLTPRLEGFGAFPLFAMSRGGVANPADGLGFGNGGGFALQLEYKLQHYLGVEVGYRAAFFRDDADNLGAYNAVGPSIRVHSGPAFDIVDIGWGVGFDLTVSGGSVFPTLHTRLGAEFVVSELTEDIALMAGPTIALYNVFAKETSASFGHDGTFLAAGLTLSLGFLPEGPEDSDEDGIPDDTDMCPEDVEDLDWFEDEDGCPDPDNDGDGLLDARDACPDEAEDMDDDRDHDGCPEEDLDQDGDGLMDGDDGCPNQAEDMDGFADEDGCPDVDNDGDGILDTNDRCPTEAERVNGFEDDDGCPDRAPAEERLSELVHRVLFPSGRDVPTRGSRPLLTQIARLLNEHPEIELVRIEGHADDVGDADFNRELSHRRAEHVRDELVRRGVEASRLEVVGHGESTPEFEGTDTDARALNRRVQFTIVRWRSAE